MTSGEKAAKTRLEKYSVEHQRFLDNEKKLVPRGISFHGGHGRWLLICGKETRKYKTMKGALTAYNNLQKNIKPPVPKTTSEKRKDNSLKAVKAVLISSIHSALKEGVTTDDIFDTLVEAEKLMKAEKNERPK